MKEDLERKFMSAAMASGGRREKADALRAFVLDNLSVLEPGELGALARMVAELSDVSGGVDPVFSVEKGVGRVIEAGRQREVNKPPMVKRTLSS